MKKLIFLLAALMLSGILFAQTKRDVAGVLSNTDGKPVKNIQLYIIQSKKYVKPEKNGEFTLKNVYSSDSIQVQVKRKKYAQFKLGEKTSLKLELSEKELNLIDDNGEKESFPLMAIKRVEKSADLITADMIERRTFRSLEDILRELAPTLQYQRGNNGTEIIIRGMSSINSSNAALVLVNNSEMSFDSANSLSVYDIASIEINKTGAGYGVRGANGVIIIKTK